MAQCLEEARPVVPAIRIEMDRQPHRNLAFAWRPYVWNSAGNRSGNPIRRTTLAIVDDADRLRDVPARQLQSCLERIQAFEGVLHRVTVDYVGSPALADALAAIGPTQAIRLEAMPLDETFAMATRMIFGQIDLGATVELHRASRGCMGPLLHIARMRRLRPPCEIQRNAIDTLPLLT